jgi:NAD(P)-dependent dehydrogenase (short-subunit alcohol dehydrogenase family)
MASNSVKGKIILITGAGAGFGKAAAEKLAGEGANIIATDINLEALEATLVACRASGVEVLGGKHDVASEADWQTIIAATEQKFGKLDALINNAGYMLTKAFMQTSLSEYQNIHKVNVESIWIGVQSAYPLLKNAAEANPAGGAAVINISSIYGQIAGFAQSAYSATKGAVRMLTKAQAIEFARANDGIRVNSVHPGPGNTALAQNGVAQMIESGMVESAEQAVAFLTQLIPAGRFAEPEDLADLMLFLCSDASRYFTASEFTLDGGYSAI